MPNATTTEAKATRTTIKRAIDAADRGASTSLTPSEWMSIEAALAFALDSLDEHGSGRATAYLTGHVLYVGPRKRAPELADPVSGPQNAGSEATVGMQVKPREHASFRSTALSGPPIAGAEESSSS